MSAHDLLNLAGLAMDGSAVLLLLATAPIPKRVRYMYRREQVRIHQRRDRITRKAHYIGFIILACVSSP